MPKIKQEVVITARDRTKAAARSATRSFDKLSRSAGSMATSMGLAFGVGGMAFAIKQSIDAADKIQKLSIQLGASTEALSQLKHAAELAGTDLDSVANSMAKMQKNASDAAQGLSTPKRAFEDLGISLEHFLSLDPESQFLTLADAIAAVENPAKRTQLAMDTMGRAGRQMIPLMADGAAGMRDMMEAADELGLTIDRETADEMADLNDEITKFKGLMSGMSTDMAKELVGPMTRLATAMRPMASGLSSMMADMLDFNATLGTMIGGGGLLLTQDEFLEKWRVIREGLQQETKKGPLEIGITGGTVLGGDGDMSDGEMNSILEGFIAEEEELGKHHDRMQAFQERHESNMLGLKLDGVSAGINLLQSIPGQSKAAQRALFLAEKAWALSTIWISGQAEAAQAAALAGPGGTAVHAAKMSEVKGRLAIAAASSLAAGASGGGGSSSAPAAARPAAQPPNVTQGAGDFSATTAAPQQTVIVNVRSLTGSLDGESLQQIQDGVFKAGARSSSRNS